MGREWLVMGNVSGEVGHLRVLSQCAALGNLIKSLGSLFCT